MYATGESSRRRDEEAFHSTYYYSDSEVPQSSSSSAPEARIYRPKQAENHSHIYSDHSESPRQMLSYNMSRQHAPIPDVRISGSSSNLYTSQPLYSPNYPPPMDNPPPPIPHIGQRERRIGYPASLDTSDTGLQPMDYPYLPLPPSALTDASGDSDNWPTPVPDTSPEPPKPSRKTRRTKEKIALAPDQPPTTQGKPRARVYVACLQCRSRKIRCDGAKPACYNCSKRAAGSSECNYDSVPKRRGPDKTPGARQRMAREIKLEMGKDGTSRRRRRRVDPPTDQATQSPVSANSDSSRSAPNFSLRGEMSLSPPSSSVRLESPGTLTSDAHRMQESYGPPGSHGCACHAADPCPNTIYPANPMYMRKPGFPVNTKYMMSSHAASGSLAPQGYIRPVYHDGNEDEGTHNISSQPSSEFTRKTWWDSLLSLYFASPSDHQYGLTHADRVTATQAIATDLRFLFRCSNYWFSFFHLPTFFGNFYDETRRQRMQPSLILSALALSVFWQSSEAGLGIVGRERALRLRDRAQSTLEASLNSGWIDETLAQAAWLLALFEICAHPNHCVERSMSALTLLDSFIRSLSLTIVDADNPQAMHFLRGRVPSVADHLHTLATGSGSEDVPQESPLARQPTQDRHTMSTHSGKVKCQCVSLCLAVKDPGIIEHTPLWAHTPAWDPNWTEGNIRKESCRRLCWSALILAAGHVAYASATNRPASNLFLADPANYALLFSGESITQPESSKETIWALFDRSFLLWHGCARMRYNREASETETAQYAVKAWLEADAIEANLNRHTCEIERSFIFQAREYVFNTRMCISNNFQRFVPLISTEDRPHRKKAQEWLTRQVAVAQRYMYGLHTITGNQNNLLARRPFFVFWFMGQVSNALNLWQFDHSLVIALDAGKAFLPAIEYLTALWPCPRQRMNYQALRARLEQACNIAGVPPPPPITGGLSLPTTVLL